MADEKNQNGSMAAELKTAEAKAKAAEPVYTKDGTPIECIVQKMHQTEGGGLALQGEVTYFTYKEDGPPLNLQLLMPVAPEDYPDVIDEAKAWRKEQEAEVARAAILNRRREEILLGMS